MLQTEPITLFLSYAQEDEASRLELEKHLNLLLRQKLIRAIWHRRMIIAGADQVHEVHNQLEAASVILLLISPDFIASDYCYSDEMLRALELHKEKRAEVFPILVRPYDLHGVPFAHLPMLPSNAIPIKNWASEDAAWAEVARHIRVALQGEPESSSNPGLQQAHTLEQPKGLHRWRKVQLALTLALICLLIAGGGIYKNVYDKNVHNSSRVASPATSAAITFTPDNQKLDKQVNISATTGTPDQNQHQIKARELSSSEVTRSQILTATGTRTVPGTGVQSRGMLEFRNYGPDTYTLGDGKTVPLNFHPELNPAMIIDQDISLAPPDPGTPFRKQIVPAHVSIPGSQGNVRRSAGGSDDYYQCPPQNGCVAVIKNTDFTGGIDPQTYTFVQQSDIDGAKQKAPILDTQEAETELKSQMNANDDWIGPPSCKLQQAVPNHGANDHVTTFTVTFSYSCVGWVYDKEAARQAGMQSLKDQARNGSEKDYVPGPDTTAVVQSPQTAPDSTGITTLLVDIKGTWIYQFDDEKKQELAKQVVGKTKAEAQQILLKQKGIKEVKNIQLMEGDQNTLPTDAQKIHFTV